MYVCMYVCQHPSLVYLEKNYKFHTFTYISRER